MPTWSFAMKSLAVLFLILGLASAFPDGHSHHGGKGGKGKGKGGMKHYEKMFYMAEGPEDTCGTVPEDVTMEVRTAVVIGETEGFLHSS